MKYSNIKKITTGPFEENCYLIYDKEKFDAVLIDPGDNEELIDSYIIKNNLSSRKKYFLSLYYIFYL